MTSDISDKADEISDDYLESASEWMDGKISSPAPQDVAKRIASSAGFTLSRLRLIRFYQHLHAPVTR